MIDNSKSRRKSPILTMDNNLKWGSESDIWKYYFKTYDINNIKCLKNAKTYLHTCLHSKTPFVATVL